ncbi:hypothetical protein ACPV3A_14565 [Paenibacillus sp. Dod16]|uniref:hypothetical protein n=1 Tax=Paenibacillus sp. Dod16 TaxID=3416392 RepID=UPI003CF21C19
MNQQHVPHYFLNQVVSELGEKCEAIYNEIEEGNIRDFLKDIISTEFTHTNTREIRRVTTKLAQATKKRWSDSLADSIKKTKNSKKTELIKEISLLESLIDMYGISDFKKLHNVETIDELIQKRVQEVAEWCSDKESRLFEYKYIRDKTPSQIKKALRYDAIIAVADVLINNFDGNLNKIIIDHPLKYADHPVGNTSLTKMNLTDKSVLIDNKLHYISEYRPGENYSLHTLVSQDLLSEEKILRAIDNTDLEIFRSVISMRDNKQFFENRKVYVTIGDLVRTTYGSDNKKNYDAVKGRLMKMANVTFNVIEPNRTLIFGIFDRLDIQPHGNGEIAEITINEEIHQNYVKGQVIRAYSDRLASFENKASQTLIFPLQKERFLCYFRQTGYSATFDYTYFIHKVQFRSKRKDVNLALIEECLQDFVNQQVTVESYERKRDTFLINFFPVETYEVEDLLGNQQLNHFIEEAPEQISLQLGI